VTLPPETLLAELARRARKTQYCPHKPHPKQAEFLALTCIEAGFGGAAGGGKSDALLMAGLQHIDQPGYAGLLLRRTYADLALPGAIMARSHEWLSGTDAHWNGLEKQWTFPSKATLSFGYCDNDRDRYRYQGAELQFIGIDELTQWPEAWYRYLFSRLRRKKGSSVTPRMRSSFNPGGIGHEWVRRRFIEAEPGGPVFIPSKLDDNPSLDATEYREALERLDPTTRKQLLEGIWIRDSGGLVYQFDSEKHTVPTEPEGLTQFVLALDFGFTDATGFAILGWREHERRVYVVGSHKVTGKTPSEIGEMCRDLEAKFHFDAIVGDVGGLGKGYAEEARRRFNVPIEPAEKKNKRGYIDLLNGALANNDLKIVRDKNAALMAELAELPWTEDRSKEADGFDNHLTDAMLYGWRKCMAYTEEDAKPVAKKGTPEWEAEQEMAAAEEHDRDAQGDWWQKSADRSEWWKG
jgi:hypothetical protein